jgi:hypothetical protein
LKAFPQERLSTTLDLSGTKDMLAEEDIQALVGVIRGCWPRQAFCLIHCDNLRLCRFKTQQVLVFTPTLPGALADRREPLALVDGLQDLRADAL